MGSLRDALLASTKYDLDNLAALAVSALQRNGTDPDKALVPFVNKLRISPEIRALIGIEPIKNTAAQYLKARAADMQNQAAAKRTADKYTPASPQGEDAGGVHHIFDSQLCGGPAGKPVPVKAHDRRKPGNARYGLVEAQAAATAAPAAFVFIASNGDDLADYTSAQGKRFLDTTTYEGAFVWLCDNHATAPSPEAKYRDLCDVGCISAVCTWFSCVCERRMAVNQ